MRTHNGYIFSYSRMTNIRLLILALLNLGRGRFLTLDIVVYRLLNSLSNGAKALNTPVMLDQKQVEI